MIVLTTSTSSQSLNVITRGNAVPTVLLLTDEETNTTESITIESYTSGDYILLHNHFHIHFYCL